MTRRVHRLATDAERLRYPNAYTFNRATGRLHNRQGFELDMLDELLSAPKRPARRPR